MPEVPPRRPMIGRVLDGRYRILAHLADGGMATVWRALDERLDRVVAVKVLRRGLADDPALVERFRHEARTAARLNDPRVVAVYDQGRDGGSAAGSDGGSDGGDLFLVMELVEGTTLREVVHTHAPLPPEQALDLLEPVAEALGVAHAAGLLHRDVKPENVLVRTDGQVKVADFGLARAVSAATAVTGTGASVLGTVSYLAPEQVEHGRADARSDVYSLGVVAYELLTGRKPFDGESPIHVAYQHVHAPMPAPSTVVAGLPAAVDDLVARLCARDPHARPADGARAAAAIRTARAHLDDPAPTRGPATAPVSEPTVAVPRLEATAPLDHHAPARRRGPLLGAAALLLALAGGGGWWFLAGPGATTTAPDVVRLPEASATERADAAHLHVVRQEAFSESVPKGTVLAGTPTAGTTLHRGDDLTLTVSRGPERYAVPALAGTAAEAAGPALAAAHLRLGATTRRYDEQMPQGRVVQVSPAAGTPVRPGTPVDLVVSRGREPITVPRLVGRTRAAAEQLVTGAGLRLVVDPASVYSTTVPAGSVATQRPGDGTLVRGDAVTVVLSKGPEMVTVPATVGSSLDQARAAMAAAGFEVRVERVLGGLFGIVRSQSTAGGRQAPKGSTITLTIV